MSPPRTDDPWEKVNRKVYRFNDKVDRAVIRPTAKAYRTVTTPGLRRALSNFFANVRMPITIANDVLQGDIKDALRGTGRMVINSTLGLLGFFDPASRMKIPAQETDFAATLAQWGVGEGPYIVLPLMGSTSLRDVWRFPVDGYFFDPMTNYVQNRNQPLGQEHWPQLLYLITLRARALDAEALTDGIYDPYVFYRDAYRQRRLYLNYDGQPPLQAIQQMQGIEEEDFESLLEQQREYEKSQEGNNHSP
jgi:phospholipid-binding lipoprotein MlaA